MVLRCPKVKRRKYKFLLKKNKKIFKYLKANTTHISLNIISNYNRYSYWQIGKFKIRKYQSSIRTIKITSTIQYIIKIGFLENPSKTNEGTRILTLPPHVINKLKT